MPRDLSKTYGHSVVISLYLRKLLGKELVSCIRMECETIIYIYIYLFISIAASSSFFVLQVLSASAVLQFHKWQSGDVSHAFELNGVCSCYLEDHHYQLCVMLCVMGLKFICFFFSLLQHLNDSMESYISTLGKHKFFTEVCTDLKAHIKSQ